MRNSILARLAVFGYVKFRPEATSYTVLRDFDYDRTCVRCHIVDLRTYAFASRLETEAAHEAAIKADVEDRLSKARGERDRLLALKVLPTNSTMIGALTLPDSDDGTGQLSLAFGALTPDIK